MFSASATKQLVFYVGLGTLFTHELDAMPNHEWRGMPLLRSLPDDLGVQVFVLAHVPLFAAIVALVSSSDPRVRKWSRFGLSAFLVVHGVLHALSSLRPSYEFDSTTSDLLIYGAAVVGALYLILDRIRRFDDPRQRPPGS